MLKRMCNCNWEITGDRTLVISPVKGTDGKIEMPKTMKWPWKGADITSVQIKNGVTAGDSLMNMFDGCDSLTNISSLADLDVSRVKDVYCMFYGCSSLTDASALTGWNVASLKEAESMFEGTGVKKNPLDELIPMACPREGSFTAYKKAYDSAGENCIVTLKIPADARRSSAFGKKCRCDKAVVLKIQNQNGKTAPEKEAFANYNSSFVYRDGETVSVPDFGPDRFAECAPGIHFFMDREDAMDYLI